ncbi:Zinc/iron permease [Glomus cerebriforme]|uniref:Zinc/iron permease n=1 Tax=Glomus cerebriforme TaxID=658196 RepID=A0A397SJV5_9GLOM|nr:Zinc/iron permease [Glomus cerebriforme]
MIYYIKSLKSSKLFILVTFLSTIFDVANTQDANTTDSNAQGAQATVACSSGNGIDIRTYNLGLHIGALFIILLTSSLGAFLPVISANFPSFRVPNSVFFFCKHFGTGVITATAFIHMLPSSFEMLSNECLPDVWHNYSAWPGAIAMMAASTIFFIEYIALKYTDCDDHDIKDNLPVHKNELGSSTASSSLEANTSDNKDFEHSHHDHAHAHGTLVLLTSKAQTIAIIILEMGICFHSVIIGMALSVSTGSDFISLLVALVFHQMFEGLGLGSRIALLDYSKDSIRPWLMSLAYGTTTPIGIAIGLGVRQTYDPESVTALIVQGVLDSISAGILLYAALVELIANDFIYDPKFRKKPTKYQASAFILLLLGAGIMALIGYWA